MKVSLINKKKVASPKEIEVIKTFVNYLSKEMPLHDDLTINLLPKREGQMTTGVRRPKNDISVLFSNRLLIDILRTISHEWIHEYQHQKMGLKDNDKIQDIGGPEENMANVLSGVFIKKFQKQYNEFESFLYNE